jgi:mRNA interferase MazF
MELNTINKKVGDIYWLTSKGEIAHPHVIIHIDNIDGLITLCSITTNMKKLDMPGNVVLNIGEGNLETQSIVEVSKEISLDPSQLDEYIGTLSLERINEIINGINFINKSFLNNHI